MYKWHKKWVNGGAMKLEPHLLLRMLHRAEIKFSHLLLPLVAQLAIQYSSIDEPMYKRKIKHNTYIIKWLYMHNALL